jgi:hypothetical protein
MDARTEIMLSTLQGAIYTETGSALTDTLARLQNAGGQTLVLGEWTKERDVDFGVYVDDIVEAVVPRWEGSQAGGRGMILGASDYLGSKILIPYGFEITESTDVEVSFLGSVFFVGGLTGILVGGFLYAALLAALATSRLLGNSPTGRVIAVSIAYQALFAMQYDPARILKSFALGAIYVGVAAALVHAVLGMHEASARAGSGLRRS